MNRALFIVSWLITGLCLLWFGSLLVSLKYLRANERERDQSKATAYWNEFASSPASQGTPPRQSGSASGTDQSEGNLSEKHMVGLTWGLLIVAFFQAVLFVWQLRYMNTALGHTETNAVAAKQAAETAATIGREQLRAYVSIAITGIVPIKPAHMITFHFVPINHGPTPARKFAFRGFTRCVQNDLNYQPPSFEGLDWNGNRMDIFPSKGTKPTDEPFFITSATCEAFSEDQLASVEKGTHSLITALQTRYEDIFGNERFTEAAFCIPYHRNAPAPPAVHVIPGSSRMT